MRRAAVEVGLALLALLTAFGLGRYSVPRSKPLIVGTAAPLPEKDLSPKGEVRTVIVTKILPGPPSPLPVPLNGLGKPLSVTDTQIPVLGQGGVFHAALFGQLDGQRLTLRTVEWLDTPAGRVSLGEATTRESVTTFALPESRPLPRWTLAALPAVKDGRIIVGGLVEHTRGPMVLGLGYLDRQAFGIMGVRW